MTKEEAVIKLKSSLREEGWYPVDHTIKLDVCEHPKAGIWSFCLAVVDGVEIEPCERYVAWDVEEDAPVYWGSIPQFDKYALENFEERGRIEIGGQANMNLQTALIILKENAGDLAGERLLYSQCPEGFEFWADRPAGCNIVVTLYTC